MSIPAGTHGPVEVDGGKVKVSLPDGGTGIFQINVDVIDLNDCTGEETQAELTLTLNGAVNSIILERETDSKFRSENEE